MDRSVNVQAHSATGPFLWLIGWIFTIGYLKLGFAKGAIGFFIWPYFLGSHFAG